MKNIILTVFFFSISIIAFGALSVEGTYQGKNLYVQNPMDDEGFGYCATKVTVNGDIMPGGTSTGAFEIDFSLLNIGIGEPVFIVIEHNDGCKPKILNPEVLLPRSTFSIISINVSPNGKLIWETTAEEVNDYMRNISLHSPLRKQVDFSNSPEVVSSDFVGSRHACIYDSVATIVNGRSVIMYCWYDNEFGYSCQVHRVLEQMAGVEYRVFPKEN